MCSVMLQPISYIKANMLSLSMLATCSGIPVLGIKCAGGSECCCSLSKGCCSAGAAVVRLNTPSNIPRAAGSVAAAWARSWNPDQLEGRQCPPESVTV